MHMKWGRSSLLLFILHNFKGCVTKIVATQLPCFNVKSQLELTRADNMLEIK